MRINKLSGTDTVRTANEFSTVHSRDLPIRAMDLFPIAIACETSVDEFLTSDILTAGKSNEPAQLGKRGIWNFDYSSRGRANRSRNSFRVPLQIQRVFLPSLTVRS